ncbi:MAG TPA: SAM-dependent methyltransferase, partial [Usitatibacteraceae bacterium]|nr:SAM-dependent methyltransferase [Usitatibacteraceae bacterium]
MSRGTLFLIPSNLSEPVDAGAILPATALETARRLRHFVAENAKSARAFLKAVGTPHPIAELDIREWPRQADAAAMQALLGPALAGEDLGLLSEAGAPAVADPGALLVAAAHQAGIVVRPLVGPSSILLGLMACGFNGQKFAFHGYLPQDKAARVARIRELEQESRRKGMTQVFIETPYR